MSNQVCNTVMLPVEEYETLRRQVEELMKISDFWYAKANSFEEQLAAMTKLWENEYRLRTEAQADNARLRDQRYELMGIAADVDAGNGVDIVCRKTLERVITALALPTDHAALDARLKAERERCAKVCVKQNLEGCAEAIRSLT